jgi:malate synthase A
MTLTSRSVRGLEVRGPLSPAHEAVLTRDALDFVSGLVRDFAARRETLLEKRRDRQRRFDAGERPDFLAETRSVREGSWTVAPLPADLLDRRVEITGPVDRKMVINALNSGARVFMADFEDANSPTWDNVVLGQQNLKDAVRGTIDYTAPETGKQYRLAPKTATLLVRPRGWHLPERHLLADGRPIPASLLDFGLYFFHNVEALRARGTGPYFYLPKLQSHLEARLWNDVFVAAQERLSVPRGTIKATVLVETLPAAFEMDEILFELREHSSGLNCGRWDYIFSTIKTLRADPSWVVPDRAQVTMQQPFMRAYTQLLIRTCHRREVHAMGGMAAQIPIRDDPKASEEALDRVRADKLREVRDGHDGTWVAHPGLVPLATAIFDEHMKTPNQIDRKREDVSVGAKDLLQVPQGTRTEAGLRHNVRVGVQYLEAWLLGNGCVPLYNLMEDAATAEISRTQVWQWVHHRATLDDGRPLTVERFRRVLDEELAALSSALGPRYAAGRFAEAKALFDAMSTSAEFEEFLTLPAYDELLRLTGSLKAAGTQDSRPDPRG